MPAPDAELGHSSDYPKTFATTHWSVVLAAGQSATPQSAEALETLCRTYWYPLYAFIRRRGNGVHDAQDLTQAFFAFILQRDALKTVSPQKGKFRSFLLASLQHFLADERDRASALKRGGGQLILSLDSVEAETRYALEPVDTLTPEKIFERRWAMALLDQAAGRLEAEYVKAGKGELYQQLKQFNSIEQTAKSYGEVAAELGLPENSLKSLVHRLRQRYRELLREEIAQTVASPGEVDEEIGHLLAVTSN